MKKLHLSQDLLFPTEIVTGKTVVYGLNGMGKSNLTLGKLPEELHRLGIRFCIMDLMGVAWGLQHGAKKGEQGIDVLILGGPHGDIEIEPTAGAVVADLVADESVSTIIDMSRQKSGKGWSKAEKIRFHADFYLRLYERQAETRRPLLLIQDEAARVIPQTIPYGSPDLARCVGAIETMGEEGRALGVGMVFVTPRSARLNKSVAELAETMIAFRTVGPNSVGAVMDWLGQHVDKARHKEIVEKLRSLPVGSALVVSPGLLGYEGIVRFHMRATFDSTATPKPGVEVRAPGAATKPDLAKYRERMKATIEKAKENDPTEMRRRIATEYVRAARLTAWLNDPQRKPAHLAFTAGPERDVARAVETRLAQVPTPDHAHVECGKVQEVVKRVEIPALKEADHKRVEKAIDRGFNLVDQIADQAAQLGVKLKVVGEALRQVKEAQNKPLEYNKAPGQPAQLVRPTTPAPRLAPRPPLLPARPHASPPSAVVAGVSKPQQRILTAILFFESLRQSPVEKKRVAVLAGVAANGNFHNNLGALRTAGLVDYPDSARVQLTEAGRAAAPRDGVPTTSADMKAAVMAKLSNPQQRIFEYILANGTQELKKQDVADGLGMMANGNFHNNMGRLSSMGVVEYPRTGYVRSAEIMFLDQLAGV